MAYTLFCIVLGQKIPFPVDINEGMTVGGLKKAIKNNKPNDFKDVDADHLTLHQIKINLDASDEDEYDRILDEVSQPGYVFTPKRKLRDVWEISQYYGDPSYRQRGAIHILVEPPQKSKSIDP